MNIKKALWFSLGCILLVIAFIGVYLPGLPWSTPAVGAAFCFAKSSTRMHNWIMNHKLFGPFLTNWADKRVFPAIDIMKSGTRKEELLLDKEKLHKIYVLRRILDPMGTIDAIEFLLDKLSQTKSNDEFYDSMNT